MDWGWRSVVMVLASTGVACGPTVSVPGTEGTSTSVTGGVSTGPEAGPADAPEPDSSGAVVDDGELLCTPGQAQCIDPSSVERCDDEGNEWVAEPCDPEGACLPCDPEDDSCEADRCVGPCEIAEGSRGCHFWLTRMLSIAEELGDAVVVTNESLEPTTVQLMRIGLGSLEEQPLEQTVLPAGASIQWPLDGNHGDVGPWFRKGGMYRVDSDRPVSAVMLSPGQLSTSNDSSLLIPDHMLGQEYVAIAYTPRALGTRITGRPSFIEVIATVANTTIEWTPPVSLPANNAKSIPAVEAFATGTYVAADVYDALRIATEPDLLTLPGDSDDLSGTVIRASAPIWVASGTRCAQVPRGEPPFVGFCDTLQEILLPVERWGSESIALPPPPRDDERAHWRIYAGAEGTTAFSTEPQVLTADNCPPPASFDGVACTLPWRGAWVEIEMAHGDGFIARGVDPQTDRFLLVGYLQSRTGVGQPDAAGTDIGDPAMYQVSPTEAFGTEFRVLPAVGFDTQFVQLVRPQGAPPIFANGRSVVGWTAFGEFETVNAPLTDSLLLRSDGAFGATAFGYNDPFEANPGCSTDDGSCSASYAHPAGWAVADPR